MLALGGGGARRLAHFGVLQALESEGIPPAFPAGASIGGLVAAPTAQATPPADIISIARGCRVLRRFISRRMLAWHEIFPTAVPFLDGGTFQELPTPLVISAVDLQQGEDVVLHAGPLLTTVRATGAVPGVLSPERLGGLSPIDGGVRSIVPVDLAWSWDPDVVIAVDIHSSPRALTRLDVGFARIATGLGRILPHPVTAQLTFEITTRAVEAALDRQRTVAVAMTGPEVLSDIILGDVSSRAFHRLDEVVEPGRGAATNALPRLRAALEVPPGGGPGQQFHCRCTSTRSAGWWSLRDRARARLEREGVTCYFCSANCCDSFERHAEREKLALRNSAPARRRIFEELQWRPAEVLRNTPGPSTGPGASRGAGLTAALPRSSGARRRARGSRPPRP